MNTLYTRAQRILGDKLPPMIVLAEAIMAATAFDDLAKANAHLDSARHSARQANDPDNAFTFIVRELAEIATYFADLANDPATANDDRLSNADLADTYNAALALYLGVTPFDIAE